MFLCSTASSVTVGPTFLPVIEYGDSFSGVKQLGHLADRSSTSVLRTRTIEIYLHAFMEHEFMCVCAYVHTFMLAASDWHACVSGFS